MSAALIISLLVESNSRLLFLLISSHRELSSLVFCTHEYTENNLDFALIVDDQNDYLKDYSLKVKNLREQDKITLPSSIKKELQINPFLRLDSKNIIFNASKHASISISNEIETLKTIREWKDNF